MATYYWVGGSGTWNTTSTTNWSTTSGGAGGAGPATSADNVIFNASSGGGTVTIGENVTVLTFDITNFTGTVAFGTYTVFVTGNNTVVARGGTGVTCTGTRRVQLTYSGSTGTRTIAPGGAVSITAALSFYISAGSDIISIASSNHVYDLNFTGFSGSFTSGTRTIYGSLAFSPTMTITAFGALIFGATSAGQTLDFGGITYDQAVTFNGVGGGWTFTRDFTQGASRFFTLTNGTVNGGGKNITVGGFSLGVGVKTLTLGSGTWTVQGTWNAATASSGLTVSPSSGTINLTSATARTFFGGGFTWPTLNLGGAGAVTISGNSTFTNITNTVQPATVTLTSGTTQTVTDFDLTGTSGNLIALNASTPGSAATLSDTTGTNSVSYVSIKDIVATGGATWEAYTANGNVNGGNNTGWIFSSAPVVVPGAGVYSPTGAIRVIKNDTSVSRGLYAADGSLRITVVTGSSYTGRYATDGSLNVVNESGSLYHPCGAIRGVPALTTYTGRYSPSGALYMAGLA